MTRRFLGVVLALLLALVALLQRRWVVVVFVLLLAWLIQHLSCQQHHKSSLILEPDPTCPILPCTGSSS